MKILVTGFEPFGGETMNPSWEVVRLLPDEIAGVQIIKKEMPVVFDRGKEELAEAAKLHRPDLVLCVGQAGGTPSICVERVGINLIDARIPDNDGKQPVDMPVCEDGENAYFSTLPVKSMADKYDSQMKAGFIHVPYIPEQTTGRPDTPSMELSDIAKALQVAVLAAICGKESQASMGTLQ